MIKEEAEKQKTESTNLFSAAEKLKVPSVDTDTKDQHATELIKQVEDQVPEVCAKLVDSGFWNFVSETVLKNLN